MAVSGKELQPVLESILTRKPKPVKTKKIAELMTLTEAPIPNTAETTPTNLDHVQEVFDTLIISLDRIPKEEARDVAYRLAKRYSRSNDIEEKESGSVPKTIPTENNLGTTLEESTA